jgi:hypothetical protein
VCQTGLHVTTCPGLDAIRDVLQQLAAGVEDGTLTVGVVIEVALVIVECQIEDLRIGIQVDQREVASGTVMAATGSLNVLSQAIAARLLRPRSLPIRAGPTE